MSAPVQQPFDIRLMNATATVLFVGLAVLLVASLCWWAVRHPLFSLGAITVQGEVAHNSAATLRANVAPQLRGNFFTVDLTATRRAFEAVPWVREATVRREFPNRLRVALQEHHPVALWGEEGGSRMVNSFGELFEANAGDVESEGLPRLAGPDDQAQQVLAMYRALAPLVEPLDLAVEELQLTGRGSWRLGLDNGALLELGRGDAGEVVPRVQRFVQTLTQVASRYGRRPESLVSADLRYGDGYALRLRGVGTVEAAPARK
ncbi:MULTISPECIES: cell division protein FtsQ/DivIB [Ramlibacter]|uniref:Cell division protein FtsQ n=1 Tax=Ramlibacter pinisoli TaxID=2682844 RepID=A0A6N8IUB5_9BURK|nr:MULTISPECIES: cell division protein FtsQ/DivIB [Ramlibacter]MBA2964548.1 FtsQ-type POTRA domain-containing protein [Ramlibacter sp. CGMCC 1.13660]MVQ29513.1 FtsQ-type POTRA domain-containing protein [Ramlibacter pinisoli]